ncbi:Uncharacterized [Syntrophomonas zehnderi OL-4]|uniref:Uncharacterized n=1 Tax=Syntrophomonas zehnderi OL-4 TaxID=690567 RepID=A0A0E4C8R7_9FIRM|nr:hypothetical protein [Syntrophomonas zehnderi]CFX66585.1 Uncharacterized [Syntrophomonas zehnderi OL-4]
MSIRTMDMQVLVQKTGDVAKIQQIQNQGNNLRQQEISSNILQDTNKNTHTVNKTQASEGKQVYKKQDKEKNPPNDKNKKGNSTKKENKEEDQQLDPHRGTNLDILA